MSEKTKTFGKKTVAIATGAAVVVGGVAGAIISDDSTQLFDQTQKINNLTSQVDNLNTALLESKGDAAKVAAEKVALEAQLANLTVSNAELQKDVAALASDIKEAQAAVAREEAAKEVALLRDTTTYLFDDVAIGDSVSKTLDSTQLPRLFDDKVYYDGDSYDAKEVIVVSNAAKVLSAADDGDFNDNIALGFTSEGALSYKLELTDPIAKVADEDIELPFLGKKLTITDVAPADNEITVLLSDKVDIKVGQTINVAGKAVQLISVADNKVLVKVGTESATINELGTKRIGGLQVYVKSVFDADVGDDFALLYVGTDVKETIADGDEYDADDRYEWTVSFNSDDKLEAIGLKFVEVEDNADDAVLSIGDSLTLPDNFAKLTLEGFSEDLKPMALDIKVSSSDVEFKADDSKAIIIDGEEVDDAKFTYDGTNVTYEVDGDEFTATLSDVSIEIDERVITLSDVAGKIVFSNGLAFEYNTTIKEITAVLDGSDALISRDESYRTLYGDIVKGDIENRAESGELSLSLFPEQVNVNIRVE